ncbi:MerR family transcriptional regulator [Mumia sp. zg.B53]|uniref:MerR family transcriptional regulator n=1 Tax=unclassified Mumia TaxID=2621872 RepID=UPI001C6DD651|nr:MULTISPECIES: MerR family transcriptional regulator [unclassified Mumia]MBW9204563.1 MerR family transcriptional regulator [Mumia sp. zg.B17]MBW9209432.1 MerR family transcriptional regulator [Mumia sp. zg.B21]MBW9214037.1 MerR family transcriptional regulator [Mumia sp. zg.B53]MDD9348498.1 MerR family transcriptional regulator [Mumia sp.]
MRVRDAADLAGVSVRTVRHYHACGLVPVPPTVGGVRDYGLEHVARLIRVRWLVESGLSLARIADLLAPEPSHPGAGVGDLREALATLDARLVELADRRERLARLLESVLAGGALTPLPNVVADFYDDLEARAPDAGTRRAINAERDFLELAYFRGEVPSEAEALFAGTPELMQEAMAAFAESLTAAELSDEEVDAFAAANVARMKRRVGGRTPEIVASIDLDVVARLYALFEVTSDERGRRIGAAMQRHLTREIESGWTSAE